MKNVQNITFSFKLSKSPLKMCIIMYFTDDFFCDTWSGACKTPSESRETNNPPYVENNRIEVKMIFISERNKWFYA